MSGGAWDYKQYELGYIADEIEQLIRTNDSTEKNEWGNEIGYHYDDKTIEEFKRAVTLIRQAQVYAQRIDWLVSGDDGEDTFHERLREDLSRLS